MLFFIVISIDKLIRDDTPRTISGTVFEDSPLEDKLNNNEINKEKYEKIIEKIQRIFSN